VDRFAALIEFPTKHLFKLIGQGEEMVEQVQQTLKSMGYPNIIIVERYSAKGRYLSLSFEVQVASAQDLDAMYTALEQVEGLKYLF
jgi:putative lipoic acid-binding regulatory protein